MGTPCDAVGMDFFFAAAIITIGNGKKILRLPLAQ
jgi:hypothetical protein